MEIEIKRGEYDDSFGLIFQIPIKGVRFQHAFGNIEIGDILLHGGTPTHAEDVKTMDFVYDWSVTDSICFTIGRFLDDVIGGEDNRIEVLITEDRVSWKKVAWLEEFV